MPFSFLPHSLPTLISFSHQHIWISCSEFTIFFLVLCFFFNFQLLKFLARSVFFFQTLLARNIEMFIFILKFLILLNFLNIFHQNKAFQKFVKRLRILFFLQNLYIFKTLMIYIKFKIRVITIIIYLY